MASPPTDNEAGRDGIMNAIKCSFCGAEFARDENYCFSPVQTEGCASYACKEGVFSFYGSTFDESDFIWTHRAETFVEEFSVICDQCIRRWLQNGWIVEEVAAPLKLG
jgi:hypothetical protein